MQQEIKSDKNLWYTYSEKATKIWQNLQTFFEITSPDQDISLSDKTDFSKLMAQPNFSRMDEIFKKNIPVILDFDFLIHSLKKLGLFQNEKKYRLSKVR